MGNLDSGYSPQTCRQMVDRPWKLFVCTLRPSSADEFPSCFCTRRVILRYLMDSSMENSFLEETRIINLIHFRQRISDSVVLRRTCNYF